MGRRVTGSVRDVHRGQQRKVRGRQAARGRKRGPFGEVGPGGADIRSGAKVIMQGDPVELARYIFLNHDPVGTYRAPGRR